LKAALTNDHAHEQIRVFNKSLTGKKTVDSKIAKIPNVKKYRIQSLLGFPSFTDLSASEIG
jgi:uncharacterized membrane-anchored protein